ncbi:MAG: RNA 2',3'-cyclic phosphodiesterase [Propionibacteriaceae bacterium]|nr:RNA 2',3'-cyclic phosphodiesterase [Propionibacteriaceae bacterium]
MLRLFIAVVPPAEAVGELDRFLEPRRDADAALRWTLPSAWHLTLAFLPSVPETAVDDLSDTVAEAVRGTGGFEVGVGGAGAFPHPDRAKVLWLGVSRGTDELARLAGKCRGAASRSGLEVDGARFRPHLTLARANGIPVIRWLRVLEALGPVSWTADEVELIRSSALPGGAGYQTLARFPLG